MGAFAAWIDRQLGTRSTRAYRRVARLARLWSLVRPAPLVPSRTIVVADFHPSRQMLMDTLGGLPARLALPFVPNDPLPGVAYSLFRTDVIPMDWGSAVDQEIPGHIDTVASFLGWERIPGMTLRHWWNLKIRRLWFLREDVRIGISPFLAGAGKKAGRLWRKVWPGRSTISAEEDYRICPPSVDQHANLPRTGDKLRITHFIGSLTSGGAERQLCNTAIAQKQEGHEVRVLLEGHPVGRNGHYLPLLEKAGIPTFTAGGVWNDAFPGQWEKAGFPLQTLSHLHLDFRESVLDLGAELLLHPPDLLHCWLDWPNIIGFLAAQIAGVAPVVLSFRCVSPELCPRLLEPWMRPIYRMAAATPSVTLVANSQAGATDYERWLGFPSGRVDVLRNAFVPPPTPDVETVARFRQGLGLKATTPVVAGVFRLDPEKRPLFFLNLIARLRSQVPDLQVVMAGCGILENEVRAEIQRLKLENVIHLLGQRKDIPVILAASQVMLLASEVEGTPNVALEAQFFGCVPILTDAGGSREAIAPGESGLVFPKDDAAGLVAGVVSLFKDPARRATMAQAGREFVARQYHPVAIHEQTMRTYANALAAPEHRKVA